jgi:DNA-directed RNA polymerase specialized sigma24 family protein
VPATGQVVYRADITGKFASVSPRLTSTRSVLLALNCGATASTISSIVSPGAGRELLAAVKTRLPEEERKLFQWRQDGLSWREIAGRTGESEALLRKRLSRALRQVSIELGMEPSDE